MVPTMGTVHLLQYHPNLLRKQFWHAKDVLRFSATGYLLLLIARASEDAASLNSGSIVIGLRVGYDIMTPLVTSSI